MGDIADRLIYGKDCSYCGVYLEPGETVYTAIDHKKMKMPKHDYGTGFSVICEDCI